MILTDPPYKIFQSTLPVRGATTSEGLAIYNVLFQSTLPVRGATEDGHRRSLTDWISIHAPRAGSDLFFFSIFQREGIISIHAPRAGSDGIEIKRRTDK